MPRCSKESLRAHGGASVVCGECSVEMSDVRQVTLGTRTGNRTICQSQAALLTVPDRSRRPSENESRAEMRHSVQESSPISRGKKSRPAGSNRRNAHVSEDLWKPIDRRALTVLDYQVAMALSGLLDGWSPQDFPTERMIIIVPDFPAGVVNFIFSGRNSGQLQAYAEAEWRRSSGPCQTRRLKRAGICFGLRTVSSISESFSSRGSHRRKPRECSFGRRIGSGLRTRQ
jgi:hypothetical protein